MVKLPHTTWFPLLAALVMAGCAAGGFTESPGQEGSIAGQQNNIASINDVVSKNPSDANALNMRGSAYGQAGDYPRAIEDFNAALKINPNYHQVYANRALIHVKMKHPDQALADFRKAIELAPDYEPAFVGRANLYRQMRNLSLALADYNRAIELQSDDPVAYYNRGLVHQAMGQHRNAIEDFGMVLGLRPDSADPFYARGISYLALDDFKKAHEDFSLVGNKLNSAEAWTYRARAAEGLGKTQDASADYKRALQIDPSFKPAAEGLSRVRGAA